MLDCLILDKFHFWSVFAHPTGGCKVHLFIDEFVINKETLSTFDDMNEMIDESCYVWLSIARATNETNDMFKTWLEQKKESGYVTPTLEYPLRNSKEILDFDRKLETKMGREASGSNLKQVFKNIKQSFQKKGRSNPVKESLSYTK